MSNKTYITENFERAIQELSGSGSQTHRLKEASANIGIAKHYIDLDYTLSEENNALFDRCDINKYDLTNDEDVLTLRDAVVALISVSGDGVMPWSD